jgi:beta-lactamase class A
LTRHLLFLLLAIFIFTGCNMTPQKKYTPEPAPPQNTEAAPTQPADDTARMTNKISTAIDRFDGKAGIYAENLDTGKSIRINADTVFPTASTHKLVVALAVYKYLYPEASATKKKQYDQHIKDMMVISDNPAFYALLDEIEAKKPAALTQVLNDLQLKQTRIHSREAFSRYGYHSVTTPYEMSVVFKAIYNENYLGKELSVILKEELAHTIWRDEIPRFMQKSKVMNKTGQLPGMMCDVGIVDDGKNRILISIYTTSKNTEKYASNFIANLSATAYNALRTK